MLIIAVLAAFAAVLITYMSRSLEKSTETELSQQVDLLVNTLSSFNGALSESTIKIASVFKAHFPGTFVLDPAITIAFEGKKLPLIINGTTVLNSDHSLVERFAADAKANGTVFVRSGPDFIRVTAKLE